MHNSNFGVIDAIKILPEQAFNYYKRLDKLKISRSDGYYMCDLHLQKSTVGFTTVIVVDWSRGRDKSKMCNRYLYFVACSLYSKASMCMLVCGTVSTKSISFRHLSFMTLLIKVRQFENCSTQARAIESQSSRLVRTTYPFPLHEKC